MKNSDQNFWPSSVKLKINNEFIINNIIINDKKKRKLFDKLYFNNEYFDDKKLYIKKKSHSTNSILTNAKLKKNKNNNKRHSWGSEIDNNKLQYYSIGDYLRQQIVEDLNTPDILYKSDEQLAFDRYRRVREYLDQRNLSSDKIINLSLSKLKKNYQLKNRKNDYTNYYLKHNQSDGNKLHNKKKIYRRSKSDIDKKFIYKKKYNNIDDNIYNSTDNIINYLNKCNLQDSNNDILLQENYLLVENGKINLSSSLDSLDRGYNSMSKNYSKSWMGFLKNTNVKKTSTFKIINCNKDDNNGFKVKSRGIDSSYINDKKYDEIVESNVNDTLKYKFRCVYDQFKQRHDVEKEEEEEEEEVCQDDKSCDSIESKEEFENEKFRMINVRKRRRHINKDQIIQGEEVSVSPKIGGREAFFRPQLRDITTKKQRRPPPPPPLPPLPSSTPISTKYKINNCDIKKYFNYPNKENSPGYDKSNNKIIERAIMGSNLSRHSEKGLTGRRTQSSGNLCDPKGKLNNVGKILMPCSSGPQERYIISGSLPNSLDDKESLKNDTIINNNNNNDIICDTIVGNMGGTLPHKKRTHGVHFSDGINGTLDLVRHRSQESLDGNPWRRHHQDSDLDLVRCKHGNFDLIRKNQSIDTVDSGIKYSRVFIDEKNHNLDISGTLPKRRIDPKWCDPSSIQAFQQQTIVDTVDGDLLMKVVHKPNCELMKNRQFDQRPVDIKLTRLVGEHQDQGYASERSPEDEHPPSLPGQQLPDISTINPESTYRVILQKSSRGLGLSLSGGGSSGPVRVKRLFPQQPAALSNKLQSGDILLAVNGVPLTGLTNYEFDIEMTKVGGSLGFTLRKVDSSALGHYVRALVREPALSDGRIQPGDKIVAVDDSPLSPMSHEEAVALLRQCGPRVKLRLYRDLAQTPVSALSPTEPDHPLRPSRTNLRQEAVDMLCDLAVRKLSPGTSNGSNCQHVSGTLSSSPRRLRRPASRTPTGEREQEPIYATQLSITSQADTSDSDQCSIKTQITNSQAATPDDIIDPPALYDIFDSNDRPLRPNFLNLSAPTDKPNFQFNLEPEQTTNIVINYDNRNENIANVYHDDNRRELNDIQDSDLPTEPASMPPIMALRNNSGAFSYKNPAYQSANPTCGGTDNGTKTKIGHSSDQDIPGKVFCGEDPVGSKGLLKWKGVMFATDDDDEKNNPQDIKDNTKKTELKYREGYEVFMVELTRGWNSRLGFSLQYENNSTVISIVHPDSVAAKDGRLKQGDILIMVNDESVEDMPTAEIIDLLRKIRGSIGITVARKKKRDAT
ncbi:uncharacterized protein LOC122852390 isoform X2 [Aphidius gifuensis]|uniref:uncharacterized protein LOC122852390 isoform X2 n=1 Tax=Aphidius gifuensis TaxID=684658 RepID=UPI001CDC2773|nr:uncharacterized protein LOC122852390 isoform X2 [Aphidius gifuensis]